VPALADLQADVRQALTSCDATALESVLVGGRRAQGRLAIHQRHYEASLVTALLEKFPATAWLIGSAAMTQVARAFVRAHPPGHPCIAEYGSEFPIFLAAQDAEATPPYLQQFGELEWHVGQVSIAISEPALAWSQIVCVGADALPGVRFRLQSGLRYVHATWAIDDLMKVYLTGSPPDLFTLLKYNSWEFTVKLFEDEYKVPLLDPAVAARLAMVQELTLPVLLFVGLATRAATVPMLGMIVVIQTFVYPNAWIEHLVWSSILVLLLTRGPGILSLDHLVDRYFAAERRTLGGGNQLDSHALVDSRRLK